MNLQRLSRGKVSGFSGLSSIRRTQSKNESCPARKHRGIQPAKKHLAKRHRPSEKRAAREQSKGLSTRGVVDFAAAYCEDGGAGGAGAGCEFRNLQTSFTALLSSVVSVA